MRKQDIDMICVDCGADTEETQEYFHVRDEVWLQATKQKVVLPFKVLCIGCLEFRLGRQLVASDFTDARVNKLGNHSARLKSRLAAPS